VRTCCISRRFAPCHSPQPGHFSPLPQHPVPADQLTAERLGCGNPGGAPGSVAVPAHAATTPGAVPHGPAVAARPTQPLGTGPWGALMAKTMEEAQQQQESGS